MCRNTFSEAQSFKVSVLQRPLSPEVLHSCFLQIAFQPEFPDSRIEKERKAVLSELQMMNTIDYRVDCQVRLRLWLCHLCTIGHAASMTTLLAICEL